MLYWLNDNRALTKEKKKKRQEVWMFSQLQARQRPGYLPVHHHHLHQGPNATKLNAFTCHRQLNRFRVMNPSSSFILWLQCLSLKDGDFAAIPFFLFLPFFRYASQIRHAPTYLASVAQYHCGGETDDSQPWGRWPTSAGEVIQRSPPAACVKMSTRDFFFFFSNIAPFVSLP